MTTKQNEKYRWKSDSNFMILRNMCISTIFDVKTLNDIISSILKHDVRDGKEAKL